MKSPGGGSAPIRAIPSSLSARAAPQIAPAAEVYDPLVKSALRQRLSSIFLWMFVVCWLQTLLVATWFPENWTPLNFLLTPVHPLTLMRTAVTWATRVLPIIVLSKTYVNVPRSCASSPAQLFRMSLTLPSTRSATLTCCGSAVVASLIYSLFESNGQILPFLGSRYILSQPLLLNGDWLYLLTNQMVIALLFVARIIMKDRFSFPWPTKFSFFDVAVGVMIMAIMSLPISFLLLCTARVVLPLLYRIPLLPIFIRPFTAHFLRVPWTLIVPLGHVDLIFRSLSLGFSTLTTWEMSYAFFETSVAQPVLASRLAPDSTFALVSGITSEQSLFRYCAYTEFYHLASEEGDEVRSRRVAFFADQRHNPNFWSRLVRHSLLLLGQDFQHFLRRGKPAPPPPASEAPAAPQLPIPVPPATPLIRKSVFRETPTKSRVRALIDSLSSPRSGETDGDVKVPDVFRSTSATPKDNGKAVSSKPTTAQASIPPKQGGMRLAKKLIIQKLLLVPVPTPLVEFGVWWHKERLSKLVSSYLPRRESDVVIIEVLSHLVCASLSEDRYGVAQRDIPKILEAFLSFLHAIETLTAELHTQAAKTPLSDGASIAEIHRRVELQDEIVRAQEVCAVVGDALKEGTARIVRTFGDKLTAFKFPPRTARKLQTFVEYC
ncbi:hypothetical protein FISHEDRAFT_48838 [Fistulina hepatica ATCC 64428]|uniref:Nucleoporin protein Ndc1-Nup n=1 Tax=Fistulina hepatica ATCC 64428 TaxID=1128425 RepID=A0A0D7A4H9_9AGAR|nr:hypothetical protein FISHEDRAFT_48838 [Fistulina hepatica ATCC 64428]